MSLINDPRWQKRNTSMGNLTDEDFVDVLEDCVENPNGGRPVSLEIIRRIRGIQDNELWQQAKDLLNQINPHHPNSMRGGEPIYGPDHRPDDESEDADATH